MDQIMSTDRAAYRSLARPPNENTVNILWYPKTIMQVHGTTKLQVGERVYTLSGRDPSYSDSHEMISAWAAYGRSGRGYVAFGIKVSAEELASLKEGLTVVPTRYYADGCTEGLCNVLEQHTSLRFPWPFNLSPSLNALYLTLKHRRGTGEVIDLHYVGSNRAQNFLSLGYLDAFNVLPTVYLYAALAVSTTYMLWICITEPKT
ncbi:MAG TPA: hypothetical protein VM901_00850 [Bdellovibrionota bacterium]|jgi:hypothetical protein|nr:hypothetical protein [Bdellovibrionota bacterium]